MTGAVGSHDEREQTLNQLLGEMDGFARQMIMGYGMGDRLGN
jgi:ATP-dependent Zn protease